LENVIITAIDYSNAVVYRLIHNFITYYVGSTTNFRIRKSRHKSDCLNENSVGYKCPIYKFIRDNGGWENGWEMVMIESYPNCKSSEELRSMRDIITIY
jgi:GIY-YIG catalytic domain